MTQQSVITPVSTVEKDGLKFVIFDAPNDSNLPGYITELTKENVGCVVRVCDSTYDKTKLESVGIAVNDWPFPDGDPPPDAIITNWLSLIKTTFEGDKKKGGGGGNKKCIGIHCVAGLGRAPVLVAIALIEKGVDPLDAVQLIRGRRRGAINAKQLSFLESYKRRSKKDCVIQ
uniref:protein-tyrosine-phosphatase n=1 Tax=Hemiselmis andersenii TaxID=464988 RepID=A0A6U2B2A1_HEMAN|mmetsp:Transcript_1454/g.3501  ORF Transcript_1454/g.3501 Transcript_1454/m.3501 type:complete len:173 (-) Transcript_1454:201-719(-)